MVQKAYYYRRWITGGTARGMAITTAVLATGMATAAAAARVTSVRIGGVGAARPSAAACGVTAARSDPELAQTWVGMLSIPALFFVLF